MTVPAWVLLVLAPLSGELVSGSMPPAEWINLVGIIMLPLLYGGGAILVRETCVRWRKGWPTMLALGAAYGIVEEGLMCKSFFDPAWGDLGPLGVYGRSLGVNWVWSAGLTGFHAVWSIAIPVTLTGLMFPARKGRWTGNTTMGILGGLFVLDVAVGFLFISKYRPPLLHFVLCMAAVAAICLLARILPVPRRARQSAVPTALFWLAFLWAVMWFAALWVMPATVKYPVATMAVMTAIAGSGIMLFSRVVKRPGPRHRLALAAGVLSLFILLAPIQEMDKKRKDDTRGMTLVGIATAAGLAGLRWKIGTDEGRGKRGKGTRDRTGVNVA
jgi:FtsH-binding integral membrane protein